MLARESFGAPFKRQSMASNKAEIEQLVRSNVGRCGLCHEMRELRESHLLPAALYRLARDPSRTNPNPVMVAGGRSIITSRQIADRFLCAECEDRFSRGGERHVVGQCARPNGDFRLRDLLARATPSCEDPPFRVYDVAALLGPATDKYLYFAASVFWRAAAHKWPHEGGPHKRFSLGAAYQEEFRLYLLGQAGFPGNGRLLVHVWSEAAVDRAVVAPCTSRVDTERRHKFCVPGITFILFLGSLVPRRHDGGALNSAQGKFMWLCPWKSDSLFRGFADQIRRSIPLGSLRRHPPGRARRS